MSATEILAYVWLAAMWGGLAASMYFQHRRVRNQYYSLRLRYLMSLQQGRQGR